MTVAEVLPMPDDRRRRLKELETVIETGWESAVAVGQALREIHDEGLFLELDGGMTFESYVKSRWAFHLSYAHQRMDAARIDEAVSTMVEAAIPITSERVGRELALVLHKGGPAKVAEAWTKVSEAYAGQRPPTAREVQKFLVAGGYRPKVGHASTGKPNARILLGQVGDRIAAAEKRFDWFLHRDVPNLKVAASTRQLASGYADRCRILADHLDAFAEGREIE